MLIRIELKNSRTKEVYFEKNNNVQSIEEFCRGLTYGVQGFEIVSIENMDNDKRYAFNGSSVVEL